jgi:hypothetical protein
MRAARFVRRPPADCCSLLPAPMLLRCSMLWRVPAVGDLRSAATREAIDTGGVRLMQDSSIVVTQLGETGYCES